MPDFNPGPKISQRARLCWLWPTIVGYLRHLEGQQYRQTTVSFNASGLLAFGEYTGRRGVSSLEQLPQWVSPFAAELPVQSPSSRKLQLLAMRFIRYLQLTKIIPASPAPTPAPYATLVEDYLQFLRDHLGLGRETLKERRRQCENLLAFLAAQGEADLRTVRAEVIQRFIVWRSERYQRHSLQSVCSALRGFLSFLYQRRIIPLDLTAAVVSPRVYRQEQCPRFLINSEIEAILAAINRDRPIGRRDLAMMLLLATYGLRGIEVIRLRLDDIDWQRQLLHIRKRKARNSTIYPLSVSVGEAVIDYLRHARPPSTHREVFLSIKAPFAPMVYSAGLAYRVKHYLARAGVSVARPGTHSFRYSCAQRLFEQGMPLKTVGDYLGHCDPTTTQRYTKIALEQLREVAAGDVEDIL